MKKRLVCLILAIFAVFCGTVAIAEPTTSSFTHPELGEFLTIEYLNGMPFFKILKTRNILSM